MSARSSSNPSVPAPRNNGPKQPSALYSMIMTPINLTVFLVSLIVVDMRYTMARSAGAGAGAGAGSGTPSSSSSGGFPAWWAATRAGRLTRSFRPEPYRSKQKKLMKMEAEEAFQLYGVVLAGLGAVALVAVVVLYYVARRAYGWAFAAAAVE